MKNNEHILDEFLSEVIHTLNSEEIYDAIINSMISLINPDGLLLALNGETKRVFHVARIWGSISCEKDYTVSCEKSCEMLIDHDSYVALCDAPQPLLSTMTFRQQDWLTSEHISCFYTIKYNQSIIGFLFIATKDGRLPSDDDVAAMRRICYLAAHALRNANLYQKAYRASITDDLTSLFNRKHAFESIDNACLAQRDTSLILLDIDDFKLYNELYGAKEGDHLIQSCARIVLQEMGENDLAFRFGADEIMVLVDNGSPREASELAGRIISRISSSHATDMVWDISVTCGISSYPAISKDASSFLHNVEQAVYYGKLEGKGHLTVYRKGLENRSQNPDIRAAYERVAPTIYALTAAIDAKDTYTFIHSMNVSKYAVILAEALGMNENEIEIIRDAGMLHDIGKISIPEDILKKTSRLTDEEYAIMKTHVENSTKMIRYLPDMDYVIPAVVGHHERYDGKGYPRGLAGEEIPLMARILTIADCFDAMTARRPYKQPNSISYAVAELQANSGTQFDPALVSEFVQLIYDGKISVTDNIRPYMEKKL